MKKSRYDINSLHDLDLLKGKLAIYHSDGLSKPRYFFRGQNAVYPSVIPSMVSIPGRKDHIDYSEKSLDLIRAQAYTICAHAKKIANGMAGSIRGIEEKNALALMQHYDWLTPVLDITATIDVAIYFAWLGSKSDRDAIVYILDKDQIDNINKNLPAHAIGMSLDILDHDFMMSSNMTCILKHRWIRQDGYSITIIGNKQLDLVKKFDLKIYPDLIVEEVSLRFGNSFFLDDIYMDQTNDSLPEHFQNVMKNVCSQLIGDSLHDHLRSRIAGICSTKTIKNFKEIKDHLFSNNSDFVVSFLRSSLKLLETKGLPHDLAEKCNLHINYVENRKETEWDLSVFATGKAVIDHISEFAKKNNVESDIITLYNSR